MLRRKFYRISTSTCGRDPNTARSKPPGQVTAVTEKLPTALAVAGPARAGALLLAAAVVDKGADPNTARRQSLDHTHRESVDEIGGPKNRPTL